MSLRTFSSKAEGTIWMANIVWIAMAVALFFVIWRRIFLTDLERVVDQALDKKDMEIILNTIRKEKPDKRPTEFNYAIHRLWEGYHREEATELVKEFAKDHAVTPIAQYWLKQVLTTEPDIARETMSSDFVKTYYQPEVAAQCGPSR